jgi:peptide/nickel transport system permease protein
MLVAIAASAAVLSLTWTPYPPDQIDILARLRGPSAEHWLGTDAFGRDVFARILAGARSALWVGFASVFLGLGLGAAVGLAAAMLGAWSEEALSRSADFLFAFPAVLSAILLAGILGAGTTSAIVAIAVFNIPVFARVTRSAAAVLWRREFVHAAQAMGKSRLRITLDHVLPNVAGLLVVQASASFAVAILAEAALSYLGLGVQPPEASWGRMLYEARTYLEPAPHLAIFPGLALGILVFGVNLLGDGLRDRLDPRWRPLH